MAKALNAIFDFCKDIPSRLNDKNLRELGSKAEEFLKTINSFRNRGSSLQQALKEVGKDYSSELSSFKSEYEALQGQFTDLWREFQTTGKDVGGKYEAIKATCMSGCLP